MRTTFLSAMRISRSVDRTPSNPSNVPVAKVVQPESINALMRLYVMPSLVTKAGGPGNGWADGSCAISSAMYAILIGRLNSSTGGSVSGLAGARVHGLQCAGWTDTMSGSAASWWP